MSDSTSRKTHHPTNVANRKEHHREPGPIKKSVQPMAYVVDAKFIDCVFTKFLEKKLTQKITTFDLPPSLATTPPCEMGEVS